MLPSECKFYGSCSASLCPLDPELKNKAWCPEENEIDEICRNREFAGLQFIFLRTQKKIARATRNKRRGRNDIFSYNMLNRNIVVRSGIEGIPEPPDTIRDIEKWYSDKERKWVEEHHEISQYRSDNLRQRGKSLAESRRSIQKIASDNPISELMDSKGVITRLNPQSPQESIDSGGNEE